MEFIADVIALQYIFNCSVVYQVNTIGGSVVQGKKLNCFYFEAEVVAQR